MVVVVVQMVVHHLDPLIAVIVLPSAKSPSSLPPTQKPQKEIWCKKSEKVCVRRMGEKAAMSKCCQN